MPSTGKEIFENLVEYPLPQSDGVKDYIFYFVSLKDGYGLGAKNFFNKHYDKHISKEVKSLEDLIDFLYTEINNRHLRQVREIIIVSHGNEVALSLPLINNIDVSPGHTVNGEYKYLSANSLAILQDDFMNGRQKNFAEKRKAVISKLSKNSWITIRACQFGYAKQGLYAFFSFLGGFSNVYAPMAWQFFGYSLVGEGMKFESKLEVYEHLSKQRFLKNRQYSPQRIEKIVRQFMNLGRYREPFVLSTQKIRDPVTDEMREYEKMIDNLNERKIEKGVRDKFKSEGLELSSNANIKVKERDRQWLIQDRIKGADGEMYTLEFTIIEENETVGSSIVRSTLSVYTKLSEARSASPSVPIQLLFLKMENDIWRAYLFDLLSYPDEPDMQAEKQKFDQVVSLLDKRALSNTSVNIKQLFEDNSVALTNAKITILSSDAKKKKWLIEDGPEKYLIKQEQSYTDEATLYHRLSVYKHFADKGLRLRHEHEVLNYIGADLDCPGTELMACLDNYSIEELIDFLKYLRNPYRPEHTIYLHHAYEAVRRKSDHLKWWMQTYSHSDDPIAGLDFDLDITERWDKNELYYDYIPNTYWKEVKASNPPKKPFSKDLFLEQKLNFSLPAGLNPDEMEMESPNSNIEALRAFESQRMESFFEVEKDIFDPNKEDTALDCEEFGQVLDLMKEHEIKDFDLDKLEDKIIGKLPETNPIWETIKKAKKVYGLTYGLYKKLEFIFKYLHNPIAFAEGTGAILAGGEVIMASRLPLLARLKYLKGAMGAMLITEVFGMMWEFIKVSAEAAAAWEQRGKIVGVRTAANQLVLMAWSTILDHKTVPTLTDGQPITLFKPGYEAAELAESGHPFIWAPDRFEKGYLMGFKAFEEQANKIFAELDQYLDDLLWQDAGLSGCQILKLRESGLIDFRKLKATIMKDMANDTLDKIQIGKKPPKE